MLTLIAIATMAIMAGAIIGLIIYNSHLKARLKSLEHWEKAFSDGELTIAEAQDLNRSLAAYGFILQPVKGQGQPQNNNWHNNNQRNKKGGRRP